MKKYFSLLIFALSVLMIWCNAYASHLAGDKVQSEKKVMDKAFRMHIPFIANKGQINEAVSFYAKTFGGTLYVTEKGDMIYSLPRGAKAKAIHAREKAAANRKTDVWVLKENLLGAYKIHPEGMDKAKTQVSYFTGKDKKRWKSNIPTYSRLSLGMVYDGIELSLKAYGKNVEKIFTVYPAGSVDVISLAIDGASSLTINRNGELEIQTGLGPVRFSAPLAYQVIDGKRKSVTVAYDVKGKTYGFRVDEYDRSHPLVIDPLLASTFVGGELEDHVYSLTLDSSNNVYITGYTGSSDFPTTSGAYDRIHNGDYNYDFFISKLNSSLTELLASTFIGGTSANEYSYSIALDSLNNVYIAGSAESVDPDDFPTTAGAYDTSHNGMRDAVVCKFSNDLSTLSASTFIGGSTHEVAYSIAIDSSDNVYISGYTGSSEFPTTSGAYDEEHNGSADVFVCKFNNSLTSLQASTFIGGSSNEHGLSVALDSSNNVYVAGLTSSSDFPTTSGAYDEGYNSGEDAFISRFNSSLTSLQASTFIGGSSDEKANSITLDSLNNVYVAGWTTSSNFPTTSGAYDEGYNGSEDVFVSRLNSDLTDLSASTFLGGSNGDEGNSIVLGGSGNVYVTGFTRSSEFPATPGAYDTTHFDGVGEDVFISKLSSDLTTLPASTFLGGWNSEQGSALMLDSENNVYVAGNTCSGGLGSSFDFPTTTGAYDEEHNGYNGFAGEADVFVSKFDDNFSTDTMAPTVSSTTPANSATDVAVNTAITATFSEEMDGSTISTDTFLVDDGSANIAGTVTYSGTIATFTPATDLSYGTTYTATITTGAKDLAANALEEDYTWSFTTQPEIDGGNGHGDGDGGGGGCFISLVKRR
jgi:hypothetical protein